MRLSKIKLAGFKSFVDPTTVFFKSNLVGVVGPNGSGKSNVIDAVRWVMGESSAKHLRGESMADVIFNGSSARKPVGQASIELIFDNQDSALGGKYGAYNEISVKRLVSRDGQSNYYLNGARCRRRDIVEIFLGTGLGPRSYAIIEQGMISRLIEAKPEELRQVIEEAAGISKYKERRRETETRMKNTQENLNRLNDLREEMGKQLDRLQRQAKTAERYKELMQEERSLRGQLQALHWRQLDARVGEIDVEVRAQETALEADIATQRALETGIEKQREGQIDATDVFNVVQGRYYAVGADIAAKEQAIQHIKERRRQLELDIAQADRQWEEAHVHLHADTQRLSELQAQKDATEPQVAQLREREHISQAALAEAEETMQSWQQEWDQFSAQAGEPARLADVERTRIQQLEKQTLLLDQRQARLQEELASIQTATLTAEIQSLEDALVQHTSVSDTQHAELRQCLSAIGEQRQHNAASTSELDRTRSQLQTKKGRLASLEALQQAALGRRQHNINEWLRARGLRDAKRLAETLQVDAGWERAIEAVMGSDLEAVCADNVQDALANIHELQQGVVNLIDGQRSTPFAITTGARIPLLSKIRSPWSLEGLLAGVYICDSIDDAVQQRSQLAAHESLVTPEGIWLGKDWARINRGTDDKSGVLHREKEIKELEADLIVAQERASLIEAQLEEGKQRLHELEEQRETLQTAVNAADRRASEMRAQITARHSRLDQMQARNGAIHKEIEDIQAHIRAAEQDILIARQRLDQAIDAMHTNNSQREELSRRRDEARDRLDNARRTAREDKDSLHQLNIQLQNVESNLKATQLNFNRVENQLQGLGHRREELREMLIAAEMPLEQFKLDLTTFLQTRVDVEHQLAEARRQVESLDHELRGLFEKRNQAEQHVQQSRERLERLRMGLQELSVRRETVQEQLHSAGHQLHALFETLPEDASEEQWQTLVEQAAQKIQRLGPVNLAAIDEFAEQQQRKTYLDAQYTDLTEALTTLENAIRKIDRETKERFQETFNKVNDGMKRMFPRLFGGGEAYLEMTGDDLLDTGISILARPPGKRISNIHLLSGGEKALTAVAMVFSIFELNPAPFCMLDEVDAPLDEANVGRFCSLVKEMSARVQFIFITHNKATMEIAEQLNGVTMHEPGVSRLVTVDVEEAVKLVAV
ncbi:MAG: chromosome segregation protein SMC [Gammaproteobacteria bacterium]|nr:chromosome segregation protein SMC [Gammaproteobacteria bacterium]